MIAAFKALIEAPSGAGKVYNIGGRLNSSSLNSSSLNSSSILETIAVMRERFDRRLQRTLDETDWIGVHLVSHTGMSRFRSDYPRWTISTPIDAILEEFAQVVFTQKEAAP